MLTMWLAVIGDMGTAPGTLVEHDIKTAKPLTITMTVYNAETWQQYHLNSLAEAWQ